MTFLLLALLPAATPEFADPDYAEYADVLREKPGLGGPIAVTLSGTAALGVGAVSLFNDNLQNKTIPVGFLVAGAAATIGGVAWWVQRGGARAASDSRLQVINARLARRGLPAVHSDDPDNLFTNESDEEHPRKAAGQSLALVGGLVGMAVAYVLVPLAIGALFALSAH